MEKANLAQMHLFAFADRTMLKVGDGCLPGSPGALDLREGRFRNRGSGCTQTQAPREHHPIGVSSINTFLLVYWDQT